MNKIQVGGFIRISKREAERRYNAGETVRFCACKLSPVNMWGCFCDCKRIFQIRITVIQIWQYFKICFPVWAGDMAYCVNFGKMG